MIDIRVSMGFLVGDLGLGLMSLSLLCYLEMLLVGLFNYILVNFRGCPWFCHGME